MKVYFPGHAAQDRIVHLGLAPGNLMDVSSQTLPLVWSGQNYLGALRVQTPESVCVFHFLSCAGEAENLLTPWFIWYPGQITFCAPTLLLQLWVLPNLVDFDSTVIYTTTNWHKQQASRQIAQTQPR